VCAHVPDSEPGSTFPSATSNAYAAETGGARQNPKREPYAVVPLVLICAGGGQRCSSLPRLRRDKPAWS
jgi:hypothetical protein